MQNKQLLLRKRRRNAKSPVGELVLSSPAGLLFTSFFLYFFRIKD
jgi:hypothetical protein